MCARRRTFSDQGHELRLFASSMEGSEAPRSWLVALICFLCHTSTRIPMDSSSSRTASAEVWISFPRLVSVQAQEAALCDSIDLAALPFCLDGYARPHFRFGPLFFRVGDLGVGVSDNDQVNRKL